MKKSMSAATMAAMVGLFLMVAPRSVRAVDGTWSSTVEGNYTNPANWASSQMPDAIGTATFNSNASYQVDWSTSVTNGAANFAAPGGQVTLNMGSGNVWTLTNAFSIGTNAGASANVSVSSGTLSVTNTAGNAVTTTGSTSGTGVLAQTGGLINLNILTNGVGRTVTNSGGVMIISSNMAQLGNLYIVNGAVVTNKAPIVLGVAGATQGAMYGATNVISGTGSRLYLANGLWNNVGSKPGNYFQISNGAQLEGGTGNYFVLGGSTATDTMLITDPGTLVTMDSTFVIGWYALANVVVSNGAGLVAMGNVGSQAICIGVGGGGNSLVVTGTGTYVRCTATSKMVQVGDGVAGCRLEVRAGATWSNTAVNALYVPGNGSQMNNKVLITDPGSGYYSSGEAWIAGGNSAGTNTSMTVDNQAVATFSDVYLGAYTGPISNNYVEVLNRASLAVTNFYLGYWGRQTSNDWLRVSNATVTVTKNMDVHGGKLIVQQNGLVKITGWMTLTNADQSVVTISDGTVTNGGMVVGNGALVSLSGASHLQVNGAFTNFAGASTVQFIGTPSAVGRIDVTGTWTNSATAKLTVDLSKYTWPSGSSVTLATFGSMPVQYAAGNITVSNKSVIVKQTASAIIAIKSSGTAVFFR